MLHVFIDTSVLLRFYSYADDTLTEVEKLSALVQSGEIRLLVPQQVVDERGRNRDKELSESFKRLDQIVAAAQIPRFAEHHEAASKLASLMKEAKAAKAELRDAITEEMNGEGLRADRVIQQLFDTAGVLDRTPEIIRRALQRRDLGNPPGKLDSLGDQINWETMLEHVPDETDLHLVVRDADFKGVADDVVNFFLRDEWNSKKHAKLYLYSGLGEFTKAHFPDINVPSDAIKGAAIKKLVGSGSYSQTHAAIAALAPIIDDLSSADALALLVAVTENSQVSDIINDDDVANFYKKLYLAFFLDVPGELDKKLEEISEDAFGLPF